jgi:hypothetical protein
MQVLDPETTQVAQRGAGTEIAMTRVAEEVKAAMVIARKFPRDEDQARTKIKKACQRMGLAEVSQYEYAKGGAEIVGPSIRILEAVSQAWGNCEAGVVELDRSDGKSAVMSYAVDLESNHREVRIFDVSHTRFTKRGSYVVTDNREIYEMVSNSGSRRRRACLQAVIPGDVIDEAIEECNKTLRGDSKEPLESRIKKMVEAFDQFGVTQAMIEAKFQCNVEAISFLKLAKLRRIFTSIKDGMGDVADFFEVPQAQPQAGKSGFGFKQQSPPASGKAPESPKAETVPVATPGSVTAAQAEDASMKGQGPGVDESLVAEARARELAESKGERGTETREQLLAEIDLLHSNRRDGPATRSGLWKQKCGAEPRGTVDLEKLRALRDHLRTVGGTQGTLA